MVLMLPLLFGSSDLVAKLKEHIVKALHNKDITEAMVSIVTVNDVLAAAIQQHGRQATKSFQDFIVASCSGGSSRGHALVKCYERHAGRSYEDLHATLQMEQGIDVSSRMDSRLDSWAGAKWGCHMTSRSQHISDARLLLCKAMDEAEPLPKHNMRTLRRVLAAWPAKAGLGIDS